MSIVNELYLCSLIPGMYLLESSISSPYNVICKLIFSWTILPKCVEYSKLINSKIYHIVFKLTDADLRISTNKFLVYVFQNSKVFTY